MSFFLFWTGVYNMLLIGCKTCPRFLHPLVGYSIVLLEGLFLWVVWNVTVMVLELMDSQLMRALCPSLDDMKPTPSVCDDVSSGCPEYNMDSPLASLVSPAWSHLVAHSPGSLLSFLHANMALTLNVGRSPRGRKIWMHSLLALFHVHRHFLLQWFFVVAFDQCFYGMGMLAFCHF